MAAANQPASADGPRLLKIGEVADSVGLSLRTVRYYEELGLVTPAARSQGGFRLYTEDAIDRLALVKQMKPLEFTLEEMHELLAARELAADAGLAEAERARAAERLEMFVGAVTERCRALRQQLAAAERFAETLEDEVRKARARAPQSR